MLAAAYNYIAVDDGGEALQRDSLYNLVCLRNPDIVYFKINIGCRINKI
jgi:hypothetical protein